MATRILVTGTRGKSSTVRLVHAMLAEAGLRPWGRVTGTVTEELTPVGDVIAIDRKGQHSVVEMFDTLARAQQNDSRSLICECMAVKPDLIELTQKVFLRADIAVITNIRADHLEDEGLNLEEIASSLCTVAGNRTLVLSSESDPAIRNLLQQGVETRGGRLLFTSGRDVDKRIVHLFPDEHPDNIAIALAIADQLHISRDIAIEGMRKATHEPFALERSAHRATFQSKELLFSNLGTINDPESARQALNVVKSKRPEFDVHGEGNSRVALIMSRWDRPLRSMQFAGFVNPSEFDAVLLAGELYHPMRRVLLQDGWQSKSIKPLRWIDLRSHEALFSRICALVPEAQVLHIVGLANIDPPIAQRLLRVIEPFAVSLEDV